MILLCASAAVLPEAGSRFRANEMWVSVGGETKISADAIDGATTRRLARIVVMVRMREALITSRASRVFGDSSTRKRPLHSSRNGRFSETGCHALEALFCVNASPHDL